MVHAVDSGSGSRSPGRLAVAAIFKNEGPYIHEWIAHHRALGVARFFIADNGSTDETTATLAALAAAGIVDHLPFPTPAGRPPQQAAYERIVRRYGGEAEWIAFLDGDEFLVPAPPHRALAAVIAALDPPPDVGAIAVNWAVYGSSGHREGGRAPVVERFTRRAARSQPVNGYYKSIVRPGAVRGNVPNPHHFPLKDGFRTVHADGSAVTNLPGRPAGLSGRIVWEPLRINHYIVKSWDEFYHRKLARGRAAKAHARRDATFFDAVDHNAVVDPMPDWLRVAAGEERRRVEALLAATWRGPTTALLHPHPDPGLHRTGAGVPGPDPDPPERRPRGELCKAAHTRAAAAR